MRRLYWSWLLVLCLAPAAADAQSRTSVQRQIAKLEDDWIKAVIARDAKAFNRLVVADFVYTEDDRVYSKEQLIKEITTGSDTVTGGRNEDLTVRVHGTTAVATGWLVLTGRGSLGSFEHRYRYTDTWIKVGGRWRAMAAQDYLKQ